MNAEVLTFRILASLSFLSFAFGVLKVFSKTPDLNLTRYRILQLGSLMTWAVILWYSREVARNGPFMAWMAIGGQAASLSLFWVCVHQVRKMKFNLIFTECQSTFLNDRGAFRFVRHPFYASYLLSYWTALASIQHPAVLLVAVLMSGTYFIAAREEEGLFLRGALSGQYAIYRSKTGMFFPKLFKRLT
jgi:protein-S-isoprenylcysteine O-methyltransferase Ste14